MTHTPGPWTAHDDDGTGTLPCVLSDKVNKGGNFYVAQCNNYEDAALIASAPDLLKACRKSLDLLCTPYEKGIAQIKIEDAGHVISSLKNAMAKAEGKE